MAYLSINHCACNFTEDVRKIISSKSNKVQIVAIVLCEITWKNVSTIVLIGITWEQSCMVSLLHHNKGNWCLLVVQRLPCLNQGIVINELCY